MIWYVGWGQRPVDPWVYLGEEAMVAWDRDMAQHMDKMQECTSIAVFSTPPVSDVTNDNITPGAMQSVHQVVLHGCSLSSLVWHVVRYYVDPPRWVATF